MHNSSPAIQEDVNVFRFYLKITKVTNVRNEISDKTEKLTSGPFSTQIYYKKEHDRWLGALISLH